MTAGSDPPSPDDPGASRQRSGPADVPASLLVAARQGDAGAFASFIEHWDGRLRPFVHHTLAGDGSTDRVLAAAYVRAYRALPRYRSAREPGLWLHRVAYLAAVDELRRLTRDPMRRRARVHPEPAPATPGQAAEPFDPVHDALRRLAPDQRAIATLVDVEGFPVDAVARAFDTAPGVVANRLASARRVLAAAVGGAELAEGDGTEPASDPDLAAATARRPLARRREEGGGPDAPAVTTGAADPLGGVLLRGSTDLAPPAPGADAAPGVAGAAPARPRTVSPEPIEPDDPDAPFPVPAWAEVASPSTDDPPPAAVAADDGGPADDHATATEADDDERLGAVVAAAIGALPVPPPAEGFWTELGRRLLAERERPAAPTPDPVARLARAHPAEAGFQPRSAQDSVTDLADHADRVRPRRRWGRPLAIAAVLVAVAGLLAGAVAIGISGRTPDGSVSGAELATDLAAALDSSRALRVNATVEEAAPAGGGDAVAQPHEVVLDSDGSWSVARTDAIDKATFETSSGTFRRILVVAGTAGAAPSILVSEDTGLGGGRPDAAPPVAPLLDDLRSIGALLRSDPERRAAATSVDGMAAWTYRRTVGSGEGGADQEWRVVVRRSDRLPIRIERHQDGALVRRVRFSGWTPQSSLPAETFRQAVPPAATVTATAHGFGLVDLNGVPILGRGDAVTPGWLPDGFELATVAILGEAPAGSPATGAGTNPPDVAVVSLAYQRGPERITVTTRSSTAPEADWTDPFATAAAPADASPQERTLGDGRFNQTSVDVGTDAVGRATLWGIDDDVVFTVGGDLTGSEAFRVANSLR